jgi:D-sedoheptulose 7-phosphate isomerase
MGFDFSDFAGTYISDLKQALDEISMDSLTDFWELVELTREEGGSVHFIGNGGSAATPSHSAGDWSKELSLRTIAHTDNISSFSAWANDSDYSNVFVGQLSTFIRTGDLVVAYTGSGNSLNVINGVIFAKENGCRTAAITGNFNGMSGGKIVSLVDVAVVSPTQSMERIEDIQLIINHIVKEAIKSHHGL